ncbi:hypothetical protein THRCLA_08720 [Thraustotheca clavata]|uniref:tRNA/rRNA methyltransferase SpoU type domain-containing protein n=1 Tax=Thraustotheca clavata TaxID=74557 RepID=A0A1V9Z2Y9_9STRA|nr:hypothetical protein THRCLA_08720 [Thraustotheca clavata]
MAMTTQESAFYIVASNLAGRKNLGTFLRTSSAFGVKQLIVVGSERYGTHGGHNAHKYVDIIHKHTFEEAQEYLKSVNCMTILGLQSYRHPTPSPSIDDMVFTGPTAFILGNEGGGLSEDQRSICTGFVHVVHYPLPVQTTPFDLDLTVQLAIVLQTYTCTTKAYTERSMEDTSTRGKFQLSERIATSAQSTSEKTQIARQRQEKKAQVENVMNDSLALGSFLEDY